MIQSEDSQQRPGQRALLLPSLAAAVLLVCGAEAAGAQTPDTDSIPRYQLDSLVVSVLGTPVRVGESAYPISVVGRSELREGKTGMYLEEALQALPGVQVQNRFNFAVGERVTIRGFGSRAQFGVRGIHVVVDGIPATLPDGQSTLDHVDIGSLGRVEALRGPASAIYGNASGGVLRFETEIPALAPIRQEATVMGGSDGLLRLQSTTTGTVGSTGYLVSFNRLAYDGYRKTTTDTQIGAPGTAYGSAERYHLNTRIEQPIGGGELGVTLNHLDLDAENPGSLSEALFDADPHQVQANYTRFLTGKEVQQTQLGLTWDGPVGGLTAEVAAYGLTRDFFNPLPFDMVSVDRLAGGGRITLGHETSSGDIGLQIRGGAEIDFQDDDRREFGNDDGTQGSLALDQVEQVVSSAVFLQASVGIGERLSLLGGLRYDHSTFEVDDLFPVTPGTNEDDSGSRAMNQVSPTVGIHVDAAPELGIFANFATGFETPTTVELGNRESGAGGFNPDLDPQTSQTFELGIRGAVQDRFAYEVTGFRTNLENELIAYQIPSQPGLDYFRNAGTSNRTGLEVALSGRLHELASAQASYSYTNARYDEYTLDGVDLGSQCPGTPTGEACRVPGLAPQQVQGALRLGPADWYVELGAEYTDEVPVNDTNEGRPADSYTLLDIRVGGNRLPIGPLQVSPFAGIRNLTDEIYVSSVTINAPGTRFYEPGPGRTFYVGGTLAISR